MKWMQIFSLVCFVVAVSYEAFAQEYTNTYECTSEAVKDCLGPLGDTSNTVQEGGVLSYTPQEFTDVCVEYSYSKACLGDIKSNCDKENKNYIEVFEVAFDYLCGEGFDGYVNSSECLAQKALKPELKECENTYKENVHDVTMSHGTLKGKMNTICRLSNEFISCTEDKVEVRCGYEAGHVTSEMTRRSFRKALEDYDCVIESSATSATMTKTISTVCLVFSIILVRTYLS